MATVSEAVVELAGGHPERTIFTRFIPPDAADMMRGIWKVYYEKWEAMTLQRLPKELVDLVPELRRFVPPGRIFDKTTYSPFCSHISKRTAVSTNDANR